MTCDAKTVLRAGAFLAGRRPFGIRQRLFSSLTNALFASVLLSSAHAAVTVQKDTDQITTGTNSWSYLKVEGESFEDEADNNPDAGFSRVDKSGSLTSFLGGPILAPNSTASGSGALFTKTVF